MTAHNDGPEHYCTECRPNKGLAFIVSFYNHLGEHKHDEIFRGMSEAEIKQDLLVNAPYPVWYVDEYKIKD